MLPKRKAIAIKYDVESALNKIGWIPETLHGFDIEPDTMVDILILHALESFENCSYYPVLPQITDPLVNDWLRMNQPAISELWRILRVPLCFAGQEASYLRFDTTVWIHYLY